MKYRKKPVVIEAIQFIDEPERIEEICEFTNEEIRVDYSVEPPVLRVCTLEGVMRVDVGDYIIKGVQGEFYPCKPAIFNATYDPVEE